MSEDGSPCVLGAMVANINDIFDWKILSYFINCHKDAEIIIAAKRFEPGSYDQCIKSLYCDTDFDHKQIVKKHRKFWMFANTSDLKKGVLENVTQPYNLWFLKKEAIAEPLCCFQFWHLNVPSPILDLIIEYVMVCTKPKGLLNTSLTVELLQDKEYEHLVLSDQHKNGYCSCGICVDSEDNEIITLDQFSPSWWIKHTKSKAHMVRAKKQR